tara:strand:- start:637 stop:1908 length:1272 start_codon:yes stop_codon:yes gene_type:complete
MYLTFDLDAVFLANNIRLSRLLQLLFVIFALLAFLMNRNLFDRVYVNKYVLIFVFIVSLSSIFYAITGGYSSAIDGFQSYAKISNIDATFAVYKVPFREIFVYLFVVFYYLILSQVFIKSDKEVKYFFKVFKTIFYIALLLGIVALIFSLNDYQLFSRQFNYGERVYIGERFHGVFGEPRDAAAALLFGLAIMKLMQIYFTNYSVSKFMLILILFLLLMTQSGSFVVSIALVPLLYLILYPNRIKLLNIKAIMSLIILVLTFYIIIFYTSRLSFYYEQILLIPDYLSNEVKLPYHIGNQIVNIYPFWLTYLKLINLDLFAFLFGSGIGSSAIEKYPFSYQDLTSPHAQITRLLFEVGIAGFISWCCILFAPIKSFRYILPQNKWNSMFFYFVLLLAISLAHRTHLIFIYVAIVYAVYRNQKGN